MRRRLIVSFGAALSLAVSPLATNVAAAEPAPTLGIAHPYEDAEGFGTVQPRSFSIASTASSTVRMLTWNSWGGTQAIGHGVTYGGVDKPDVAIRVVAFDLGDCNGQYVYQQVARVGPGQSFNPSQANNVCHVSSVGPAGRRLGIRQHTPIARSFNIFHAERHLNTEVVTW